MTHIATPPGTLLYLTQLVVSCAVRLDEAFSHACQPCHHLSTDGATIHYRSCSLDIRCAAASSSDPHLPHASAAAHSTSNSHCSAFDRNRYHDASLLTYCGIYASISNSTGIPSRLR